ncbi:MAG: HAMP domain-containing histidine kinase [Lentimicrobiaceae bacterium]|nr:HAMP domain-containing histidine kinase [Lentimicrobiaceae bacterium]
MNVWDTGTLSNSIRHLLKSANGILELLHNLLTWAQIQTGRRSFIPLSFNLVSELHPDLEIIRNMAIQKDIAFEALMPEDAVITGDKDMLITVVRNLLTNAVKFTAQGGMVTLDISPCRDGARPVSTTRYIVSVSDTGAGIATEQIPNLFRIDNQRSAYSATNETGAGLGLIVCSEFLKKHGSKLHIESEEGKGSKFWFELS